MNERFKKTAVYIVLCGAIAVLSCFAAQAQPLGRGVIIFIGELAVMAMFSLYFPLAASSLSEARPDSRRALFCAADCVSLSLKIAFAALCAISGGVMLHAAALIVDCVFSRILFFGCFRECASAHSNL